MRACLVGKSPPLLLFKMQDVFSVLLLSGPQEVLQAS